MAGLGGLRFPGHHLRVADIDAAVTVDVSVQPSRSVSTKTSMASPYMCRLSDARPLVSPPRLQRGCGSRS